MPYERTQKIEERFEQVIALIEGGTYNAQQLSLALGVSRPTIHRIIVELRRRRNEIRSVRDGGGWHYEFAAAAPAGKSKRKRSR